MREAALHNAPVMTGTQDEHDGGIHGVDVRA
jgi:hypothetical protein